MTRKSTDLLQALLDRQKAVKAAPPSQPMPVSQPAPLEVPVEKAPPPPTLHKPSPALPGRGPKGLVLSFPGAFAALGGVLLLVVGAYIVGRSSGPSAADLESLSSAASSIGPAPSVPPFQWSKGFTVQAVSLGLGRADRERLDELTRYLLMLGVAASSVEVTEGGKKSGALFVGGTDRADERSLVRLRDWLREIPGPDGYDWPFREARIREIPKRDRSK